MREHDFVTVRVVSLGLAYAASLSVGLCGITQGCDHFLLGWSKISACLSVSEELFLFASPVDGAIST